MNVKLIVVDDFDRNPQTNCHFDVEEYVYFIHYTSSVTRGLDGIDIPQITI